MTLTQLCKIAGCTEEDLAEARHFVEAGSIHREADHNQKVALVMLAQKLKKLQDKLDQVVVYR